MARHLKNSTPLLTKKLIQSIAQSIQHGCYVETAVAFAGISKQTFYRWLKSANEVDANPLLKELSDAVTRAMAEAEIRDLAVVDKAIQNGDWKAACWRLERKYPKRWGRHTNVHIENKTDDELITVADDKKSMVYTHEDIITAMRSLPPEVVRLLSTPGKLVKK